MASIFLEQGNGPTEKEISSTKTQLLMCQDGSAAAGSGKEPQTFSHKQKSQHAPVPLDYRVWVSLQAAPVACWWCGMHVLVMLAMFVRANWYSCSSSRDGDVLQRDHSLFVDAMAVGIYIISYATSLVVLLVRPHLCEACFVGNTLTRIFFAALMGLKLLPITATFKQIINLSIEKMIEVLLMAPIEQVRLSRMVPLRVMLMLGYAFVYIHNEESHPWTSALLVNGSALLFQWLMDARYRKVYAQRGARQQRLKTYGSADELQQDVAALTKSALLGSKDMQAGVEINHIQQQQQQRRDPHTAATPLHGAPHPHTGIAEHFANSFQEPSSSSLGSGSASRPGMGSGSSLGVLSPPLQGRATSAPGSAWVAHTSRPLVFRGGYQNPPAGIAAAAQPIDPTTKARLQQVRKCLDRSRPKYTTHFCHHKVSLKVPCTSTPCSLASSALSDFGSLVTSAKEKEVQVLNAAMRAGCILVVLDLREGAVALPECSSEDDLGQVLATAAKQWLHDTNLAAEIAEDTPVALQVNGSMFLCHLKSGGKEWSMEGPLPAAPSAEPHAELRAASPTVLLPASTDVKDFSPHAGGSSSSSTRVMGSSSSSSSKCTTGGAGLGAEVGRGNAPPAAPAAPSQQVAQRDSSRSAGNGEVDVTVRVWVYAPKDVLVEGWEGDGDGNGGQPETGLPMNADDATAAGMQVESVSGAPAAAAPLSVLARAFNKYLVTHVTEVPTQDPAAAVGGPQARLLEVHGSLPTALAALAPGPLCIELWGQQTLLSHSTQLLLPKEQAQIAAELQDFASGNSSDSQDFLVDLSSWLSATYRRTACPPTQSYSGEGPFSSSAAAAAQPSARSAASTQGLSKDKVLSVTLLRQAVLWGVPTLASLLLERLLEGCPSTHAAFEQIAHAPQEACWSHAKDKGVDEQQDVAQSGGLLHLALLSANQHAMLTTVLEWGRQWGGSGGKAFEWGWQERNAEGLTPLEIAVGSVVPSGFLGSEDGGGAAAAAADDGAAEKSDGMPGGDEIEEAESAQRGGDEIEAASGPEQQPMLSEEAQKRAEAGLDLLRFSHALESSQLEELVLNLLDPTQPALSIAAAFGQQQQQQMQMQEQLHWEAQKLQVSSGSRASAGGGEFVAGASASQSMGPLGSSSSAAAAGCSSKEPFKPPPRPQPPAAAGSGRASLPDAFRASLYGFSNQGMVIEEEYRSWCRSSTASLANRFSLFVIPLFIFSAVQSTRKQLYSNAAVMVTYAIPFFAVLLAGYNSPKKREFRMKMVKLTHWTLVVCFGLNILPTIIARKLALTHTDIVVECFLFRFVDQVQVRALVTERLAQTFALGLFYSSLNMPWPILQAVVINLVSLVVGIALDVRNRRTYMQVCSSSTNATNKAKML